MKPRRIWTAILFLALLLTGCQTPPEEGSAPTAPGSGWDSRPLRLADELTVVSIPRTPDTASFFLTRRDPACEDGEVLLEQSCYAQSDRDALAEALPEVRGRAVEEDGRMLINDSLPIYGLRVGGVGGDFEAVCQGRLWLDNQGHVLSLSADPDFSALWERFTSEPEECDLYLRPQNLYLQPALRELALCSGNWDSRFMVPADHPVSEAVSMELNVTESGLDWTITNGLETEILHGDDSHAVPEVLLDGAWYKVPEFSDKHYDRLLGGLLTRPGRPYPGSFWQEPYGVLPDGNYRLVLRFSSDASEKSYAAAPFTVQNGQYLIPSS